MKTINILLILTMTTYALLGQRQLDIQGDPTSTDTVAIIRVNSTASTDVVGLAVLSEPQPNRGVGGYFYGGDIGIYGSSQSGTGISGTSNSSGEGVYGSSSSGAGIYGTSLSGTGGTFFGGVFGAQGTSSTGTGGHFIGGQKGVHGNSPSGKGIYGESSSGIGIHGESSSGTGIYGKSYAGYLGKGIHGFCSLGSGVYGESIGGDGVTGRSEDGPGVYGVSTSESIWSKGVYGSCVYGPGVFGQSAVGEGVYGTSDTGKGGYFFGGGGVAIELGGADSEWGQESDDCVLRADSDDTGSDLIIVANDIISFHMDDDTNSTSRMLVYNDVNTEILSLDEPGNFHVTGNITAGGTCCSSSDVNRKEKLAPVITKTILEKVVALPISEWQFIGENVRHMGPMAQDFYTAFGLGANDTSIASVDADGIALVAIQALKAENDALKQRIDRLEAKLASLEVR